MKRTTIVLVAQWTGWCGPCSAERPLVLTRTGRHTLRSWLSRTGDEERPLVLTCRLCGVGQVVPPESEDPEIVLDEPAPSAVAATRAPQATAAAVVSAAASADRTQEVLVGVPADVVTPPFTLAAAPGTTAAVDLPDLTGVVGPELHAARSAVGSALSALLQQRAAQTPAVPALAPVAVPPVPLQRSVPAPVDGLQALQLLAEGLDVLSPAGR